MLRVVNRALSDTYYSSISEMPTSVNNVWLSFVLFVLRTTARIIVESFEEER